MAKPPPPPPRPVRIGAHAGPPAVAQKAGAATFAPTKRVTGQVKGAAEELLSQPDGSYRVRSAERGTLAPPTGVYNFVRVQGATRNEANLYVSARMPHAHLAAGRPVLYAGTAKLDAGRLDWWSNYSGTYQPVAELRAQARLPVDKFVAWQKLQMQGVGLQRGMLNGRRPTETPTPPAPGRHGLTALDPAAKAEAPKGIVAAAPAATTAPRPAATTLGKVDK
jgi:hypothetical protein